MIIDNLWKTKTGRTLKQIITVDKNIINLLLLQSTYAACTGIFLPRAEYYLLFMENKIKNVRTCVVFNIECNGGVDTSPSGKNIT